MHGKGSRAQVNNTTKQRPFKATSTTSYLVGRLIGIVYSVLVASSEQQDSSTVFQVVDGTDMERRVARGVLGVHVGSIKEQMFKVLNHLVAAGLREGPVMDWGEGWKEERKEGWKEGTKETREKESEKSSKT